MPDEKEITAEEETEEAGVAKQESPDAAAKQPPVAVMVLSFAVVVLLLLLLAMNLRKPQTPVEVDLPGLKAEVEAHRSAVNRELVAMGLSPIQGGSESLDEIAGRLKKDSETLVALAGRFQQMLIEKDSEVTAKGGELLQSEKLRQNLAVEVARLHGELQAARSGSQEVELMRTGLAGLREQNARLEQMLSDARQELQTYAGGGSVEDRQVLQRQLEEANRARDFFEKRVKELEGE